MVDTLLYFGSLNPVHRGHISICEYMLGSGMCSQIWLIVSPQNPLKEQQELASEQDRLEMARIAVSGSAFADRITVSDIEFSLPKPSYTIDTMRALEERFPQRSFALLIGSDNVDTLDQWKDYEQLMRRYKILAYPRKGYVPTKFADRVTIIEGVPEWDISSTEIRQAIAQGDDCEKMVCKEVMDYIHKKGLWIGKKCCKAK